MAFSFIEVHHFFLIFFFVGSKEEVFFDSQPWLESDCEDFFSISAGKINLNFSWKEIYFFSWLSSEEYGVCFAEGHN